MQTSHSAVQSLHSAWLRFNNPRDFANRGISPTVKEGSRFHLAGILSLPDGRASARQTLGHQAAGLILGSGSRSRDRNPLALAPGKLSQPPCEGAAIPFNSLLDPQSDRAVRKLPTTPQGGSLMNDSENRSHPTFTSLARFRSRVRFRLCS